jgi:hypothetical protein
MGDPLFAETTRSITLRPDNNNLMDSPVVGLNATKKPNENEVASES